MSRTILLALLAASAALGLALAGEPTHPVAPSSTLAPVQFMKAAADLEWKQGPPSLPPGARAAVLEGDPSKEGFFAMRLKLPAGYAVPPHFHPNVERLTVIEGTFLLGMADKVDEAKYRTWSAGSYISMPPGMPHFAKAKTEVVLQLATIGPWSIVYLNPADDPRAKRPSN